MTTKFNMVRDINGFNGFGLPFTDTAYSATLAASTEQKITVPSSSGMGGNGVSYSAQWIAVFNYEAGSTVWVANNTTAAVPAGGTFAATLSEMNPAARYVKGGDVLSFITAGTGIDVSVSFYSIT